MPPHQAAPAPETLDGRWYAVEEIAPGLYGIGEPLYEQRNWSYLIVGAERALLFDTGSYFGDITDLAARLAAGRPLVALPSHMHYDHLGNVTRFSCVALPDLPVLRACASGNAVTPPEELFLGSHEDREAPTFHVTEWLPIGTAIDLGGRAARLLHTPGHSPDSVSLWLADADILLAADFLYPGPLYAQTPGASIADYRATADTLLPLLGHATTILGAHAADAAPTAPRLARPDLECLLACLDRLLETPPVIAPGATATLSVSPHLTIIVGRQALSTVNDN
ncbi:MAG: MBL fold metallo-hydrolase [Rhizobiales bacterium]|nr:MBL fold metallo-hydrolase [Hyphomicrobiales bacterium]